MSVFMSVRDCHRAGLRQNLQSTAGALDKCNEKENSGLLGGGKSSDGDAGRRAGGGEKEGAGETSEEGEGETPAEEAQGGRHVVWR